MEEDSVLKIEILERQMVPVLYKDGIVDLEVCLGRSRDLRFFTIIAGPGYRTYISLSPENYRNNYNGFVNCFQEGKYETKWNEEGDLENLAFVYGE